MNNQIKLNVDSLYPLDLKDDFMINETDDLYEFLDGDPVKAFHLGINVKQWFEDLDRKRQYLYSKQLRHNKEGIEKYVPQMKFWTDKFPDEESDLLELSEYLLNNMFWDEESEELDRVKLALFLGQNLRFQMDKQNGEELA